jgi:hypothetical protein
MITGKQKYGLVNWRSDPVTTSVYYDAAMRHLLSWWDGENVDEESGCHPLAHVMACCAILLDAEAQGTLNQDRPTPTGRTAEIIGIIAKANKKEGSNNG